MTSANTSYRHVLILTKNLRLRRGYAKFMEEGIVTVNAASVTEALSYCKDQPFELLIIESSTLAEDKATFLVNLFVSKTILLVPNVEQIDHNYSAMGIKDILFADNINEDKILERCLTILDGSRKSVLLEKLQHKLDRVIKTILNITQMQEMQKNLNEELKKAVQTIVDKQTIIDSGSNVDAVRIQKLLDTYDLAVIEQNRKIEAFLAKFSVKRIAIAIGGGILATSTLLTATKHVLTTLVTLLKSFLQ